jgi:hypothetical protein
MYWKTGGFVLFIFLCANLRKVIDGRALQSNYRNPLRIIAFRTAALHSPCPFR